MIKELILSGNATNYLLLSELLKQVEPNEIRDIFKEIVEDLIKAWNLYYDTNYKDPQYNYYELYDREHFEALPYPDDGASAVEIRNSNEAYELIVLTMNGLAFENSSAIIEYPYSSDWTNHVKKRLIAFFSKFK